MLTIVTYTSVLALWAFLTTAIAAGITIAGVLTALAYYALQRRADTKFATLQQKQQEAFLVDYDKRLEKAREFVALQHAEDTDTPTVLN